MKYSNKSIEAFFLLVRAGLFGRTEGKERLREGGVVWKQVYRLAKEQFVVGLVAEGIERLHGEEPPADDSQLVPKKMALHLARKTLFLERRNRSMNQFIAELTGKMRERGIDALLLKGQGVAQCYERPSWRTCGDVDLLLSDDGYSKAKEFLTPQASYVEEEIEYKKHLGMDLEGWLVELHGSLRCGFSARVDRELDKVYEETFHNRSFTTWKDGEVPVLMPSQESHLLFVFAHLLNHFYKGGVVVRQLSDWCRMIWAFRDNMDLETLEHRLKNMGLMSEWRAFGAYAVEYLGIHEEAVPFYSADEKWKRKAKRIQQFILKSSTMDRNKGQEADSLLTKKSKAAVQRFWDLANHLMIFPLDTVLFMPSIFINGLRNR